MYPKGLTFFSTRHARKSPYFISEWIALRITALTSQICPLSFIPIIKYQVKLVAYLLYYFGFRRVFVTYFIIQPWILFRLAILYSVSFLGEKLTNKKTNKKT